MKAAIISEFRYEQEQLNKLKQQDVVVNYTLLPQFYQSYNNELNNINHKLIRRAPAVIFRLENLYATTKDAIEYALFLKKQVKIITPDGTIYTDVYKEEWKVQGDYKMYKHPVLQLFESARNEYFEAKNNKKQKEILSKSTEGITESEEYITNFVSVMARQYRLDVDYYDKVSVYNAFRNLQFYLDNNIEYALDKNEVFTVGLIEPEESGYFTADMFNYNLNNEYETYECESFGDETLLEDTIYKNTEEALYV